MAISASLRKEVRDRAQGRCEYCGIEQSSFPFALFHVEHVIARQHGGASVSENLCLACHWCNLHKGPNIATLVNGVLTRLFHPRRDQWNEHFAHHRGDVVGLTAIGEGTMMLLNMNDGDRRRIRSASG